MANKDDLFDLDETTASNNDNIQGANIAENCAPSGINNAIRGLASIIKRALGSQGSAIASAAMTAIGAPGTALYTTITGTTAITSFGTVGAGTFRIIEFVGALTLTHNATSLKLPGSTNIVTAAGDVGFFLSLGGGNWKCLHYQKASGAPVGSIGTSQISDDAVTYAKMQNVSATSRLLGRATAGTGNVEELTVGAGLEFSGTQLNPSIGHVARYYDEYAANTDLSNTIPLDDTPPTNSEGTQILSRVATTTSNTQRVRIRFQGFGEQTATGAAMIAALFRGPTCVQVSNFNIGAGLYIEERPIALEYEEQPGVAGSYTYSVRVGASSGAMRMNGTNTGRLFGGAAKTTMTIEVFEP